MNIENKNYIYKKAFFPFFRADIIFFKIMKKIFFVISVFFLWFWISFSETTIELKSDKEVYSIDENISIEIDLKSSENKNLELNLEWLDNFKITSRRQSKSITNINWQTSSNFSFLLSMLAENNWKYTIWPVRTNSWLIESNTIEIEIQWERIMINNNFPKNASNNSWNSTKEDVNQNIDEIDLSSSDKKEVNNKVFWVYWEEMNDVYENKKYFLVILYLLISLLIFIYLLSFIFKNIKNKGKKVINTPLKVEKKDINYNKLISSLKTKYLKEKKDIFYHELSKIFRVFLDDKIEFWLSNKSFTEVKVSLKNKSIIELYEKIYFPEYNNESDSEDVRIELIYTIKDLIKKHK